MKVILDTNFLIDFLRFNVGLNELAGSELFTLDTNIVEIERLAERKTAESKLANLALQFLATNNIKILKSMERETDNSLVTYSKEGYAIATHDKVLKGKLKKAGARIIYIRQKRYLVVE